MTISIPQQPWTLSWEDILEKLAVSLDDGLDETAIQSRREQFGANQLQQKEPKAAWQIFIDQFKSVVVLVLIIAAIVSFALGQWIDGIALTVVIIVNALIGFFMELKAVRSMEALQKMSNVKTKVRRNGKIQEIPAEEVVVGDIIILESGDIITADLRLIEASKLQVNESPLTGESTPVSKQVEPIDDPDVPVAERANMLFKGTSITRGAGKGVVVVNGMDTQLGEISAMVEEAEEEVTPLEERLDQLGHKLVWITFTLALVVALLGIVRGQETRMMVETAIALAVAAVPEGLPIVATIALAQGMRRMAQRNALVNQLAAVETLGGTNIICTDKTGTLTENQMTVTNVILPTGEIAISGEGLETEGEFRQDDQTVEPSDHDLLRMVLQVGVLCNNAALPEAEKGGDDAVGDPVEIALLVAGAKAGWTRTDLLDQWPEEREEAFDPEVKMMGTFHRKDDHYWVAVKGAPETLLKACTHLQNGAEKTDFSDDERQKWQDKTNTLAEEGLRVLALATKDAPNAEVDPYEGLTFLGVVGLLDPPREDVRSSIDECQAAGIRVVMVTGDQPVTARQVGFAVGLVDDEQEADVLHGETLSPLEEMAEEQQTKLLQTPILARVSPKQKLDLIAVHQQNGAIVAMTGDGVNDAPALKKADIGIAMGNRGTQVAREAADMVLKDDAFSTIVIAIQQGRVIFNNIRKFMIYLLSGNMSQIIAVSVASVINIPLPILPLQILYLNIVNDVFPSLALGVGKGDASVMNRPPRDPQEPILRQIDWFKIGGYGFIIALSALGTLALSLQWLGLNQQQAVTASFLTIALGRLWHVFNMRDDDTSLLDNEVISNPFVWGALALCLVLITSAVYLPGLSTALKTVDPGLAGWGLILIMSLLPLLIGQLIKLFSAK